MTPRAAGNASTTPKLSGKRKQSQTAWPMTSAGKRSSAQVGQSEVVIPPGYAAQANPPSQSAAKLTVPTAAFSGEPTAAPSAASQTGLS